MSLSVRATNEKKTLVADSPLGSPKDTRFTVAEAEIHAARCNTAAKALGIKTRYVVSED